ncbi:MAG: PaaI family thioesterase [Proteobacteria bacterium]|nr:PaaI family thioesterase [Pseudomonadota bacterium]
MTGFEPRNPDYAAQVSGGFERHSFMALLGVELVRVEPGFCELHLPWRKYLLQQHGYFHGGAIAGLLDSAAGFAAYSLMPADANILTVEYKLNFVAPGTGSRMVARGEVLKPGRTLTVVRADAFAIVEGEEKLCCASQQTLMMLADRHDQKDGEVRAPARAG